MVDGQKTQKLGRILGSLGSVAVAFSGGTDSAYLLAASLDALGPDRVLAITADSPALPRTELEEARALTVALGARHTIVPTQELSDPDFSGNSPDRCYYCKQELFRTMRTVAAEQGYHTLAYGATADDVGDHRPGMRAASEAGARAPLLEAGLGKAEVRELSRHRGLSTWDKPAMACLSSRIPYGTQITTERLGRVEQAEDLLRRELGIAQVRVRDHDTVARIEVDQASLEVLVAEPIRTQVISRLKALGYLYVSLDLEGFRSGSMNESLPRLGHREAQQKATAS
ncbi:MAG: ATP-dependent sacrificial sulfur transferase LarE [Anaerolineae bacterium]